MNLYCLLVKLRELSERHVQALILDCKENNNSSLQFEIIFLFLLLQSIFTWRVGERVKVDAYSKFLRHPSQYIAASQ